MKILYVTFASAKEFLDRLAVSPASAEASYADADSATLAVATRARYDVGESVILEIGFPGLPNRILTRTIAARATDADQCFRFAAGEEQKRDFLIAIASGRASASWKRRHRRFPVRMPARYVVQEGREEPLAGHAETEDMGSRGIALRTSQSLPDGARVTVVLAPGDGTEDIEFTGHVVWTRGEAETSSVGVEFDELGSDQIKRLRRMIRDVKLRGETAEASTPMPAE